jgi:hypothetical protein
MESLAARISPGRTPATVRKILSNLRTLSARLGESECFDSLDFLQSPPAVVACLETFTLRSRKTYISSAIVACDAFDRDVLVRTYRDIHTYMRDAVDDEDNSHVKTAKQADRMVPFDDLIKAREAMRLRVESFGDSCTPKQYQDVQAYMLLCITTMGDAVLRNQELCKMVIRNVWERDPPQDKNYFLIQYGIMEMYVYKTFQRYGRSVIALRDDLRDIIVHCLDLRPQRYAMVEDAPFLINENGKPLTLGGGIQRLYERAGLHVSPTIVRNIIATERTGKDVEAIEQAAANARNFAHSLTTHLKYCRTIEHV